MFRGQLTQWNGEKGFGFIKCDVFSQEIFIHISALKHMSRAPKPGDYIHFDVEEDQGKRRANHARIEGVKAKDQSKSTSKAKLQHSPKLIYSVLIIVITGFVFERFSVKTNEPIKYQPSLNSKLAKPIAKEQQQLSEPTKKFRCDGRQYCSQMTSRKEAEYFNDYCPNTKMDGDNDGIPCENDSRF
ncbi:cold shock domain-containing protein [Thalassotalea eurytherma]|uniref:Cold-shock protein n=1 Tax=Thalassotalea eurytherma TaxID=1144278 RepID=A0ABQ6H5X8_9GAMM|nr:cold shock domain-containing protein [Thalassotalea eurytherma]GLX81846.1 cold-shock protein [Thalassotalea eurytherma]